MINKGQWSILRAIRDLFLFALISSESFILSLDTCPWLFEIGGTLLLILRCVFNTKSQFFSKSPILSSKINGCDYTKPLCIFQVDVCLWWKLTPRILGNWFFVIQNYRTTLSIVILPVPLLIECINILWEKFYAQLCKLLCTSGVQQKTKYEIFSNFLTASFAHGNFVYEITTNCWLMYSFRYKAVKSFLNDP